MLHLLRRIVFFQEWGISLAAFCLLALLAARRRSATARPLPLLLGILLAADFLAYVITTHDQGWHIRTSANRVFLQLWPSALVAVAVAVKSRPGPDLAAPQSPPDRP